MDYFQRITSWFGWSTESQNAVRISHEECTLCGSEFDETESDSKSAVVAEQEKILKNDNGIDQRRESDDRIYAYMHSEQGLNRRELGRVSWAYLHTLANYYPENPSLSHQKEMVELLWLYMKYYPCGYCSDMTIQELYRNPPRVKSRKELSVWMCEIHNEVNARMGKPMFDCSKTAERWRV